MSSFEIIIIAIVLAMDAFAVSITCGICKKIIPIKDSIKVGLFFGGFQAIMPVLGYYTGHIIPFDITFFDHWVAFGLLAFIGIHMIKESLGPDEVICKDLFKTKILLIASIATSIDALAAGFSLYILNADIMLLVVTTGTVTLILSIIGVSIGKKFGHLIEHKVELISGIILIIIGLKILIEHLISQ